jgi:outer membrane protein
MKESTLFAKLTAAALALGIAVSATAQEGLSDIYQRALENDPVLRQAEANYLATLEAQPQARSNLLPNLTLDGSKSGRFSESSQSVGFGNLTLGSGSESRNASNGVSLSISQPLVDFGSIRTLRQAEKTVALAETDLATAQQDLLIRTAEAYFNVLAAEDTLASQIAARESIARQLEQAQRRFEVGLIAITDVQQTQAAYDTAVAAEIAAERTLSTAQEFLREIVNDYVTNLRSPGDDLPLLNPDPQDVEQWVDAAEEQNLALISSRISADIAQDDIDILRAARLPTLDLSGSIGTSSSDNKFTTIAPDGTRDVTPRIGDTDDLQWSINFRMPLYTGGFNRSRIQQSVFRHRAAMETLERVARQTERETRDAYLGVISEISRVQALRQAVESSQTALRATEAGFEVGTQTTVDVLIAQENLRQAETNYARSRYDYILNVLRLKQAAGSLGEGDIEEVDGWLE